MARACDWGEQIWQDADVLSGNNASPCDVLCYFLGGTDSSGHNVLLGDFKSGFDNEIFLKHLQLDALRNKKKKKVVKAL